MSVGDLARASCLEPLSRAGAGGFTLFDAEGQCL